MAAWTFEVEAALGPLNCRSKMIYGNKKGKIFPALN
jgi:hypothetical protein